VDREKCFSHLAANASLYFGRQSSAPSLRTTLPQLYGHYADNAIPIQHGRNREQALLASALRLSIK